MACIDLDYNNRLFRNHKLKIKIQKRFFINNFRIGVLYPNLTADFRENDCPIFWQSKKIEIKLRNIENDYYLKNIQISAYIAIVIDVLVGIVSLIINWRFSDFKTIYRNIRTDEVGLCNWTLPLVKLILAFLNSTGLRKMKFIFTIILVFVTPMINTIFGMLKITRLKHFNIQKF